MGDGELERVESGKLRVANAAALIGESYRQAIERDLQRMADDREFFNSIYAITFIVNFWRARHGRRTRPTQIAPPSEYPSN